MKKTVVCLMLIGVLFTAFFFAKNVEKRETGFFRIHVRANSNEEEDQAVKLKVRDKVVELLTPVAARSTTKEEAMERIEGMLCAVSEVATEVLEESGFSYGARAKITEEAFPTRVYEEVTLPSGVYDCLILELGSGKGDNWWCVVYPPLCFQSGNGNVTYKSRIAEIVSAWRKGNG